jgi:epoxyqueuosine reductase
VVNAPVINAFQQDLAVEARRLGFVAIGVAPAALPAATGEALERWLDDDCHGAMEWMKSRSAERKSPEALWPDARSVIALAMSYAPAHDPLAIHAHGDRAAISVYAQGRDYHDVVKKALKALARWIVAEAPRRGLGDAAVKVFVDTAPVLEKPLAQMAGLGWQGKHTNLVSRSEGSWLFLGEIYTSLELAFEQPGQDRCGSCSACQDACPTNAFPAPYRLDARRCISYLTIEHKGPIPIEFRKAMGNRIYGCDDCLAVCPWNKFAQAARAHIALMPRAELLAARLSDFLALDDAGFRQLFSGSPIKRIGRDRFVRNCLIAAGNSGTAALMPQVQALRGDSDPVIAETADWAAACLRSVP